MAGRGSIRGKSRALLGGIAAATMQALALMASGRLS
jgi:hypothetical protein